MSNGLFTKAAIGVTVGSLNGLFGAGGGTVLVPALEKLVHMEVHKAHATAIAVILPLSLISVFIYANADTPWSTIFWVSSGGVLGGVIGARALNKIKTRMLYKIFGLCMIVAAIRMILG
ncbi:MAG: sulfite exporter TauE/SafE family protein [Clostridiales bacterium]|nr:sulfite exporter TauE/SafE family protein [Clostridiales bacterium]